MRWRMPAASVAGLLTIVFIHAILLAEVHEQ